MAVNDTKVQTWIDMYFDLCKTAPTVPERNECAFRLIKDWRNVPGNSTDEDLAAAEHYLFARHMVSNAHCSVTQMKAMTRAYDGSKMLIQDNATLEKTLVRHNPANPPARATPESLQWGLKGCDDGEADRLAHNPHQRVPTIAWDAMKFNGPTRVIAEIGKWVTPTFLK